MPYYWLYYLVPLLIGFAEKNPAVALVAVVFLGLRPWLPDPVVLFRNLSRLGSLKRQAHVNPANVIVRRDLVVSYLELRRPRAALRYADEALARDPKNREIAYLRGLALLKIGQPEEALRSLAGALGIDPDAAEPMSSMPSHAHDASFRRDGEALLAAAQALDGLGRYEQAEQALESAASFNTSTLEPLVRLAWVRRKKGDTDGSYDAAVKARQTFAQLPGFMKRRQLGWWAKSWT